MNKKYHFHNVNIVPRPTEISSRSEVNLNVSYMTKYSHRLIEGVPVIAANMDTIGTAAMAETLNEHSMFTALSKFINYDKYIFEEYDLIHSKYNRSFFTSGLDTEILEEIVNRAQRNNSSYKPNICLDVANGYMYAFLDKIKEMRDKFPNAIIMAGNVCTPEGVENIIEAGADIVKAGIAQGGVCDTKNKAGIGYPQFSVAQECGQAANQMMALCCSDGGIKSPADICKALAAGSHFVMAGSIFAGYDECDAEWREVNNVKQMKLYGMSSEMANNKYFGGLKEYRTSEGIEKWIDYKGSAHSIAKDIKGGLTSCCSYCNTSYLEHLKKNAEFILI